MEPVGLALAHEPLNIVAIVFLIGMAVTVFFVAYRARGGHDEDET